MSHLTVKSTSSVLLRRTTMVAGKEVEVPGSEELYIKVEADGLPDPETGDLMENHPIYIPPEAISSRMVKYSLRTHEDALDAILREHAQRLHGLEKVTITHSEGSKSQTAKVLKQHTQRIVSDYLARTGKA